MSLLLYTTKSCYPCDRAKKTLINSKLAFKITSAGATEDILYYPTLCLLDESGNEVARLVGPNFISLDNIVNLADKHNIVLDRKANY